VIIYIDCKSDMIGKLVQFMHIGPAKNAVVKSYHTMVDLYVNWVVGNYFNRVPLGGLTFHPYIRLTNHLFIKIWKTSRVV